MKVRRTVNRAFTLVEILIVVVILGILAAIVVPQFTNAADDARISNFDTQLSTLQNQIELFNARTGAYPVAADFTTDSANTNFAGQGWGPFIDGGYLKEPPRNPISGLTDAAVVTGAGVRFSAGDGWAFNSTDNTIYATGYNEVTGQIDAAD